METLNPCYLHGVGNFLSQGDSFKLVGFLLFAPLKVCTKILKAQFSISAKCGYSQIIVLKF